MHGNAETVKVWVDCCKDSSTHTNRQFLLHQRPIQTGGFIGKASSAKNAQTAWSGQQAVQYSQDKEIGIVPCRCMIRNFQKGCFSRTFHGQPVLTPGRWFRAGQARWHRSGRDGPEKLLNAGEHLTSLEITCHTNNSIIRPVMGSVMIVKIIPADGLEVHKVAYDFVVVRVNPEGSLLDSFAKQEEWLILIALTLGDDNSPF